jgi:hypothetical protein
MGRKAGGLGPSAWLPASFLLVGRKALRLSPLLQKRFLTDSFAPVRLLQFLVLLCVALSSARVCAAQTLTISVVDMRSGEPHPGETVVVTYLSNPPSAVKLEGTTGTDGKANFHLPNPLPPQIVVDLADVKADFHLYPCYSFLPIETQRVMNEGLISCCVKGTQDCHCKFDDSQLKRWSHPPGTLVFPVRSPTWFERFWWRHGYWS